MIYLQIVCTEYTIGIKRTLIISHQSGISEDLDGWEGSDIVQLTYIRPLRAFNTG